MTEPLVVVQAGGGDVGILAQLIADAFHDLDVSQWLIPDPGDRRARYPAYFRGYAEHALTDGLVYTTPARDAAALWIPAAGPTAPPEGYAGRLAVIAGPWIGRFLAFDEELDCHHPAGSFHHHLAILAVHPAGQRRGTGTALLAAHHARLDARGIPAYLEAASPGLRDLYLRHGYTDWGSPIQLPAGPRMYPMWREPLARASDVDSRPCP